MWIHNIYLHYHRLSWLFCCCYVALCVVSYLSVCCVVCCLIVLLSRQPCLKAQRHRAGRLPCPPPPPPRAARSRTAPGVSLRSGASAGGARKLPLPRVAIATMIRQVDQPPNKHNSGYSASFHVEFVWKYPIFIIIHNYRLISLFFTCESNILNWGVLISIIWPSNRQLATSWIFNIWMVLSITVMLLYQLVIVC